MKVVHICLTGPVNDGFNYQENILTKYHVKSGFQVSLICSKWIGNDFSNLSLSTENNYINIDGVNMIRLGIKNNKNVFYKFKKYIGLYETLEKEKPDIIFIHNISFLDLKVIKKYKKRYRKVQLIADNHSDFSNSATNLVSKIFLHKIFWRFTISRCKKYIDQFYGVLPSRVSFLIDVYKISKDSVELLVMGGDDEHIINASDKDQIKSFRDKYKISKDDFLIATGGKIDSFKAQTLLLMKSVSISKFKNVKLIVFGSVSNELIDEFYSLVDDEKVIYAGWLSNIESYSCFASSDLAAFPGRHSVYWEQCVSQGIPLLCKYWEGTTHIDIGGNVEYLYEDSVDEICIKIKDIVSNTSKYNAMLISANSINRENFLYSKISSHSISCLKLK